MVFLIVWVSLVVFVFKILGGLSIYILRKIGVLNNIFKNVKYIENWNSFMIYFFNLMFS